jgi:magnesium transporter
MPETLVRLEIEDLQKQLNEVQDLLRRHKVVENLVGRQDMPKHELVEQLVHKQNLAEVRAKLDRLHAADIAFILEALPLDERLAVWDLVKADRDGEILLEVSDAVRESLIAAMDPRELVAATGTLEADEIADIAPDLPKGVIEEVVQSLPVEERERLRAALSYPEGSVGALMNFDHVAVREDVTLEAATSQLRRLDELPDHTDQLFVIDRDQGLKGTLPLGRLIVTDLHILVSSVAIPENVKLNPEDAAEDAANAFERYGLVSAPVVDPRGRLIGRLTVDAVVDYIRQKGARSQLAEAGLAREEDIFAPVLNSFKNRWSWLAINLVTAFIASRVIGLFEDSIARLVALAALMPIVAGIGGNSGNQTITMIVRALALSQIQGSWKNLLVKEIGVALLNGTVWGTLLGVMAYVFYGNVALGGVMALAMTLNLVLAALMGVSIPWVRARFGKDPAVGSSVLITACTDSGGFFIFLGLATLFLV